MNGTVIRKEFAQALNTSSRFIAQRAQLPILSNILIRSDKTKIILYATNLEMSISLSIGAKINSDGEIAVPARTLTDLVNSLSGENIDFSVEQETLHISSNTFKGTVAAMNTSDFPTVPQSINKVTVEFPTEEFLSSLSQVIYSVSTDETRPVLSGVFLKVEGNLLTMVASDGYRLAMKSLPLSTKIEDFSVIIPRPILAELNRFSGSEKISFELRKADNQVIFAFDNAVLSSRTVEGDYPPFETVITKPTSISVSVNKNDFLQAVKVSAIYARDGGNAIKLSAGQDNIKLSAQSSVVGSQETKIDAKVDGGETEVSVNYKFVEDVLNVMDTENISIQLQDSSSPVKFREENNQTVLHLVMPLKG